MWPGGVEGKHSTGPGEVLEKCGQAQTEAPKLKIGDQAYIKAKFFRTRWPSKKLLEKNLGPYDMIGKPGTHSVTLSPTPVPLHPPGFPCITTGTCMTQPISSLTAATATAATD